MLPFRTPSDYRSVACPNLRGSPDMKSRRLARYRAVCLTSRDREEFMLLSELHPMLILACRNPQWLHRIKPDASNTATSDLDRSHIRRLGHSQSRFEIFERAFSDRVRLTPPSSRCAPNR